MLSTGRLPRLPRSAVGLAALVTVSIVVALAILGPVLWHGQATANDFSATQQGPSMHHWFGTDELGRDVLARVLDASRLSLELAGLTTLLGAAFGVVVGVLPTILPRPLARLVTAFISLVIAFPGLLLALFLAVIFGVGARGAVLAVGVATAPGFARLTQTLASSVASADYLAAARLVGVHPARLVVRHVLPNVAEPLIITPLSRSATRCWPSPACRSSGSVCRFRLTTGGCDGAAPRSRGRGARCKMVRIREGAGHGFGEHSIHRS